MLTVGIRGDEAILVNLSADEVPDHPWSGAPALDPLVMFVPGDDAEAFVEDAAAALERVRAAGGEGLSKRTLIAPAVGYRAELRDPAGTTMGLFERTAVRL